MYQMINKLMKTKPVLEKLYRRYNHAEFIKPDPLQFLYRYKSRADREIAGFLAAGLAYGRVGQIEKSLNELFGRTGKSPSKFVREFDKRKRDRLKTFKHRFTDGQAISDLLVLLKKVLRKYGSIEKFFLTGYRTEDENIVPALSRFCDSLLQIHRRSNGGNVSRGLKYLLANPKSGSACKRLNLFLRWMVRSDEVDAGVWKSVDKAKLIVPVDVHMGRLCKVLGFYERKTVSMASAVEITNSFRAIIPSDPAKYDFSLSRVGILDNCTGRHRNKCAFCELFGFCFDGERN